MSVNMNDLTGAFVFLQKLVKDPKNDSTYLNGEYVVVVHNSNTLTCVKPEVGYGGCEMKSFLIGDYIVADAYRNDAAVRKFANELLVWSQIRTPRQFVETVYTGAERNANMVLRMLERVAPVATEVAPRFDPGTVVTQPSLVADTNGVAWWVNPDHKTVTRA